MMSVTEIDVLTEWQDSQPAALPGEASPRATTVQREAVATGSAPGRPNGPANGQAVKLDGLGKAFGERQVLHGIDLDIAPGEFVAIIGRSGCGKSTLLRLLAGLETPSARVEGGSGDTRFMFQDARLLPWARVLDNVARGLKGDDARERARQALAQVGLADRAGEWPARLSGGQRQRVALARALVHAPKLLLLDEPLGALDALTRIEMQRLIETLWTRHRFTALLVTHDVAEAVALADRVLLIEDGQLALDLPIDLPRPRRRDATFASLEQRLLDRVLSTPGREPDAAHEPVPLSVAAPMLRWAV